MKKHKEDNHFKNLAVSLTNKSLLLMVFTLFTFSFVYGQQKTVTGTVKDNRGNLLPGVSVYEKKTKAGTITDINGAYKINVNNPDDILSFSYLGFTTTEVSVKNRTVINIVLEESAKSLDEVVVIGYGQVSRRDLTGAVSNVKPVDEEAAQSNSINDLLRGKVAGMQVSQSGGSPGSAMSVKIRGVNSLRSNNEPLYVIDGIIVSDVTDDNTDPFSKVGPGSLGNEKQNALTGINPQDIENIEVLKDASATAIYGSRGANGVILITTKQGKAGRAKISFTQSTDFSVKTKKLDVLGAQQYGDYINEIYALKSMTPRYQTDTLNAINWQDALTRTGVRQNYRLTISGASDVTKANYYIAAGFLKAEGIVMRTGLESGDAKINIYQPLNNKLVLKLNLNAVFTNNTQTTGLETGGGMTGSTISQIISAAPFTNRLAYYNTDVTQTYLDPRAALSDYDDISAEKRFGGSVQFEYKISNVFTYSLKFAGDTRNKERKKWYGPKTYTGYMNNGLLGLSIYQRDYYLMESLLMFKKKIDKDNNFNGTVGLTYDNTLISNSSVASANFATTTLRTDGFGFGNLLYPFYRDKQGYEIFSLLARFNYNLKEKYLFTLTGRADASSKFATGNKFSYFPAISTAWRMNEEPFIKKLDVFSNLKLRLGYGISGNQGISPYQTMSVYYQNLYSNAENGNLAGQIPGNLANKDLKWETTGQLNGGFDFGFFKNRLSGTIDLYYKKTNDLLQTFTLPPSSTYLSIVKNIGDLENKGIDLSLTGNVIQKKNFSWVLSGNISINRNKILNLGLPAGNFGTITTPGFLGNQVSGGAYFRDPANIFLEGQPLGMYYGYKTDGVYQTAEEALGNKAFGKDCLPGDIKIIDQTGDKDIDATDKVIIGNPNPKFNYGFSTTLNIKRFSIYMAFNGVYGNQIVNGNAIRLTNLNGLNEGNVLVSAYENAWRADKPTNSPRIGYDNIAFVDRYVEDGSFLRLSTAALKYSVSLKRKNIISAIDLSLTGSNLFLLTSYSGYDPEVNSFTYDPTRIGIDWNSYPRAKSLAIGLNVTF